MLTEVTTMSNSNCYACAFSSMEPDDDRLICNAPSALPPNRPFGIYLTITAEPTEKCGQERKFFEQHPRRNHDGTLKR